MGEAAADIGANETSPPASPTKSISTDYMLRVLRYSWHTNDWHSYRDETEARKRRRSDYDDYDDIYYDVWHEHEEEDWYEQEEERARYKDLTADWSQTERGSHVDFASTENVPLKEETFLGRGAVGDVYETEVLGFKLAWKRIPLRRQVAQKDLKEMEILKKLSHTHMIKLIGTYTHRQCLGLLLEPVARLDLHSLFDDIEAYWSSNSTPLQHKRLVDVYFYGHSSTVHKASPIYFQIGCLVSAVAYLHDQKIRHKDLKPSNILLTPTSLILSDFGSATDFSLLSQSATDNERGTPKYFAPEVAEWEPNGRAADIFSLGCILLEILTLDQEGTLDRLRAARSTKNTAYYANLDRVNDWIPLRDDVSPIDYNLIKEIRAMLSHNPDQRPSAQSLLERLRYCDKISSGTTEAHSIFGSCCRLSLMKKSDHEEQLDDVRTLHYTRIKEVDERGDELQRQVRDLKDKATKDAEAAEQEIKDMEKKHRREMKKARHPEITGAENETTHLRAEVQRLTAELIESRRMLEQADTAFAQTIQQNDTSRVKPAKTKSLNDGYLAGDERAANPQTHNGTAKRDSPTPPTDPSSKKGRTKPRRATSLDSMFAQPGENKPTNTASESTEKSDTGPRMAFNRRSSDEEEMWHVWIREAVAKREAKEAAKEKKKELRASQGRWPRLRKLFGSKVESPVEGD